METWKLLPARADLQAGALGEQQRDGLKIAVGSGLQAMQHPSRMAALPMYTLQSPCC